jgi:hypothetical protein
LYVFIALPVQFWHKHSAADYSRPITEFPLINEAADGIKLTSYTPQNAEAARDWEVCVDELEMAGDNADNCKMCSHHYSNYLENSARIILINRTLSKISYSSFQSSFPREEILSFSNKGPPTTI